MRKLRVFFPLALTFSLASISFNSLSKDKPQDILSQASHAVNEIAHRASPAVVSITSLKEEDRIADRMNFGLPPKSPSSDEQLMMGIGSGVIVKPEGVILTNYHVVQGAERVTVSLDEKQKLTAHLIGQDPKTDLAVIQLDKKPSQKLPVLQFADSDLLKVGDWIIAIGSPFGLNRTVTSGIVSAVGRGQLGVLDIEDFIQTDAAINPGNSGGPLLNSSGEIVGINTAIFSQTGNFTGVGFAVPSKIAHKTFDEIMNYGHVIRGYIGMMAQDLDKNLARFFKAPSEKGALVSHIQVNGPADQASIKIGDVITKYAGKTIRNSSELKSYVENTKTQSNIPIELTREGSPKSLTVSIEEQPIPKAARPRVQLAGQTARGSTSGRTMGISVEDIPPEFTALFGIPSHEGAIISEIKAGSPAFDAGLMPGDVILSANKNRIHNAKEFHEAVKNIPNADVAILYVQRGQEEKLFVPVDPIMN